MLVFTGLFEHVGHLGIADSKSQRDFAPGLRLQLFGQPVYVNGQGGRVHAHTLKPFAQES